MGRRQRRDLEASAPLTKQGSGDLEAVSNNTNDFLASSLASATELEVSQHGLIESDCSTRFSAVNSIEHSSKRTERRQRYGGGFTMIRR